MASLFASIKLLHVIFVTFFNIILNFNLQQNIRYLHVFNTKNKVHISKIKLNHFLLLACIPISLKSIRNYLYFLRSLLKYVTPKIIGFLYVPIQFNHNKKKKQARLNYPSNRTLKKNCNLKTIT